MVSDGVLFTPAQRQWTLGRLAPRGPGGSSCVTLSCSGGSSIRAWSPDRCAEMARHPESEVMRVYSFEVELEMARCSSRLLSAPFQGNDLVPKASEGMR